MKTITVFALIITGLVGMAQNGFEFILVDNLGRTDTVVFAINTANATSGIDSELSEVDLYGSEMDSIEIRSIQRDSVNHICLSSGYGNYEKPFYFSENIDLKKDYRSAFSFEDDNFEFKVNAVEYPITIIADFTKWYPNGMWFTQLFLTSDNCEIIDSIDYTYSPIEVDTIIIDSTAKVKGIIVKFEHEVSVKENKTDFTFAISPNPISDSFELIINNGKTDKAEIIIYSANGCILGTEQLNGRSLINIDCSSYQIGLYLIHYNDNRENIITKKIIKK